MGYILGIDIGTGSVKALAVNTAGGVLAVSQHYYPTTSSVPGASEQDPELIWAAFKSGIFELYQKLGPPVAIGLSSAMHSLIPVNEYGRALRPMMTWADSRSANIAEKIRATEIGKVLYEETGTPVYGMSPLFKLIWLHENDESLFADTYKFISIKEYIWHKLFGEFKVDHSIASATGLFDIIKRDWHGEALKLAQISGNRLSEPVPTNYAKSGADLTNAELMIFGDAKFVIGASDGCMANLGSRATENGVAAVTIGTSGAVRIASNKPILNFKAMTFNYILDQDTYICGGPVNNGGIALQWLLKNVFGRTNLNESFYHEIFNKVEGIEAGSKGLLFLPYLAGERAPIWNAESCGTFFGLRHDHHQADLTRAVLEGICYALNEVLLTVEQPALPITQIHVSGGFVKAEVWMQMLADITGKKVLRVQLEDASALGAVQLTARAMGLQGFENKTNGGEVMLPDPLRHEIYLKYFSLFKEVFDNLSGSMHQLYALRSS